MKREFDLKKYLLSAGVDGEEAAAAAEIIGGANQSELLYMTVFLAGIKTGRELEKMKKRQKKKAKNE